MGNVAVTTSQQLPFEHDANSSNMELNGLPRGRPGGPLFFLRWKTILWMPTSDEA